MCLCGPPRAPSNASDKVPEIDWNLVEELGRWPRRLLHLNSRKSLKWLPGNLYRDDETGREFCAPKYSALSYTWGRYRLHDGEQQQVEAMKIDGTKWEVPRICPHHGFTTAEFDALLTVIEKLDPETELLWIDVACINQERSNDNAMEVGRQAAIFQGAETVYIWLRTLSYADVWVPLHKVPDPPSALEEYSLLMYLIAQIAQDPWFTSLWTLQEAYLGINKSRLLGGGSTMMKEVADMRLSLDRLLGICFWLQGMLQDITLFNGTALDGEIKRYQELVEESGVNLFGSEHPLRLYQAAGYRTTSRPLDRVYAIQQVFGCRLGITGPGAKTGSSISMQDLEDELGSAILEKYPYASQMHYFIRAPETWRGWYGAQNSRGLPRLQFSNGFNDIMDQAFGGDRLELLCDELKAEKCEMTGKLMGRFSGSLCNLDELIKAMKNYGKCEFLVALDCQKMDGTNESYPRQGLLGTEVTQGSHDEERNRMALKRTQRILKRAFEGDAKVLKLAKLDNTSRDYGNEIVVSGLLLGQQQEEDSFLGQLWEQQDEEGSLWSQPCEQQGEVSLWKRWGVCMWKLYSGAGIDKPVKDLEGITWFKKYGYFG